MPVGLLLALLLAPPAAAAPPQPIRLGLLVERSPLLAPAVVAGAIEEAAAVWAPYGVSLSRVSSVPCLPAACDAALTLHFSDWPISGTVRTHSGQTHLAAIRFEKNGTPTDQIQLYYPGVVRLADMLGVRNQLVTRIAGRALAHEIGHYLLRSPLHSANGLMQAVHRPQELVQVERSAFLLSIGDVNRLNDVRAHAVLPAFRQAVDADMDVR